jgi:hypothetical protein
VNSSTAVNPQQGGSYPSVIAELIGEIVQFVQTRTDLFKTEIREKLPHLRNAALLGLACAQHICKHSRVSGVNHFFSSTTIIFPHSSLGLPGGGGLEAKPCAARRAARLGRSEEPASTGDERWRLYLRNQSRHILAPGSF